MGLQESPSLRADGIAFSAEPQQGYAKGVTHNSSLSAPPSATTLSSQYPTYFAQNTSQSQFPLKNWPRRPIFGDTPTTGTALQNPPAAAVQPVQEPIPQPYYQPAPAPRPEPATSSSQQSASVLKAVILLEASSQVDPEGRYGLQGINTENLTAGPNKQLKKRLSRFLGQPLEMQLLQTLSAETNAAYREAGRPVVDTALPRQEIVDGIVQLLVVEGRLGQVKVEGNKWFSSKLISSQIRLRPGDTLDEKKLKSDLEWVNSNPFREVSPSIEKGAQEGQTDLVLGVKDRFPVRVSAGFDDSGSKSTGDDRFTNSILWGNAFGLEHLASYQSIYSADMQGLLAHVGSYSAPLPWRHQAMLFGSYAESAAQTADNTVDIAGKSWQVGLRYQIPLADWKALKHELSLGFDFKQSNSNLFFGGTSIYDSSTDVIQWQAAYNASLTDKLGITSAGLTFIFSPGELTDGNSEDSFEVARANADPQYIVARLDLSRTTRLPMDFSWMIEGQFQYADGALLGSEQIGAGGYATVRGYNEREVNGDRGFYLRNELRTPPISLFKMMGFEQVQDQLQFLAFCDYAFVDSLDTLPGETTNYDMASVGPGMRFSIAPYLSLRFDYGWQMKDTGLNAENGRAHLGVTAAF